MSAYKKLKSQDAFVTTYVAKKNWIITGSTFSDHGIQVFTARSSSTAIDNIDDLVTYGSASSGIDSQGTEYPKLVYKSLEQLYYRDYNNSNGSILEPYYLEQAQSGSSITSNYTASLKLYDHYEQSSFTPVAGVDISGSRYLHTNAVVYSLPRDIIGTHIEPNTFKIIPRDNPSVAALLALYTEANYVLTDYIRASDSDAGYHSGIEAIVDDGEGNLTLVNSTTVTKIGNIFYAHGIIVFTDPDVASYYRSDPNLDTIAYKSNQPIYTYNYHVKVSDYEFNHTLNPTALMGSDNRLRDNVSGSSFQPYITSVGLYNDVNELIGIGKLSQPLTKPAETELTIQVKLDI